MGAIVKSNVADKIVHLIEKPAIVDVHWDKESEIGCEQKIILFTKEISEARLKCEQRKQEYQTLLKHYQQIMYNRYYMEIYGRIERINAKSDLYT